MKRLNSLLALLVVVLTMSCSDIPENDNPIIGIWNDKSVASAAKSDDSTHHEWVFNDAYLGRYQSYTNNVLSFKTDFRWSVEDDVYTITYPGTDMPTTTVSMKGSLQGDMLEFQNGSLLAIRE
ncbi:hypothetical protein JQC67_08800 [Aurantibacter crassamenti]|uniref:hypothetical protein n=1 Tax=Aurantibacter crassamenti TaxID=1837375 RepID=UPI00193AD4F4|nr:hypothetical protein [Aurantibacter crassamenti]MBM1106232.1 hypothetical protein [Aurantibacter crassamenti]